MNNTPIKTEQASDHPATPTTAQQPQSQPLTQASEWQSLRTQLEQDSFNTSTWNRLIEVAEDSGDVEKVKEAYDALLQKYPNTVRVRLRCLTIRELMFIFRRKVVCSDQVSQTLLDGPSIIPVRRTPLRSIPQNIAVGRPMEILHCICEVSAWYFLSSVLSSKSAAGG
jgi:hypothetical protein